MAEYKYVGKSVLRVDALAKVTGKAKYMADFMEPGMLHCKLLRSPYPHAKILSIDTSKAEKLTGVRAVITGRDIPDRRLGTVVADQPPIARDIVRFVGETVAVVAADTEGIAEDALELIDVDYKELPAVFDPEEAMKPNPPVLVHPDITSYRRGKFVGVIPHLLPHEPNVFNHWKIRQGDVDKGFESADLIVENRFSTTPTSHCCMEGIRADAWIDSEGVLCVRSSRAGTEWAKPVICRMCDLPYSKVRVICGYVGGSFGGKGQFWIEVIVSFMALKTRRAVRLVFTREQTFINSHLQVPIHTTIKDGVKKDGTIVARQIKMILDAGAYSERVATICRNASFGAVGVYRIPNFKLDSYGVYTNKPMCGSFRGFGAPQINWAIEQQMDIIAEKLGIDAVELRKKNLLKKGDRDVSGMITPETGQKECLEKVAEWIKWSEPVEQSAGPWRRGKGIACGAKYTIAGTSEAVTVKVHPDEVIEVRHGCDEIGQGLNTVVSQIAAEQFGVSIDKIKVSWGDSAVNPPGFCAGSSRGTWHVGNALIPACQDAKRQLFKIAAPRLGVQPDGLETREGQIYVKGSPEKAIRIRDLFAFAGSIYMPGLGEVLGRGEYTAPYIPENLETGQSERPVTYYSNGAHGIEVAVNIETGEVKVEKVAGAFDSEPINPKMCEQQIESGLSQGIGQAIYEGAVIERGIVINPSFADYKIPTAMEIPSRENVKAILVPTPLSEGPYGAKGLGEGVLVSMLPAIGNAVYNAVGIRITDLPVSREKVIKALREARHREAAHSEKR